MAQIPGLPVEILLDIVKYLNPSTPTIGNDAAWVFPGQLRSWWDTGRSVADELHKQNHLPEVSKQIPVHILPRGTHPYNELFSLRQANRAFNKICSLFLYHDFNLLSGLKCDPQIAIEIIDRYRGYIRTIRIAVEQSERSRVVWNLIIPCLSECVTALGVYYTDATLDNWTAPNNVIIEALNSGRVKSFGIYSTAAFQIYLRNSAPPGASALLDAILHTKTILPRLTAFDLVLENIHHSQCDILRTQLRHLRSLTIRGSLRRNWGQIWDAEQQKKWFPSCNLTSLQLIQCPSAYAGHIPHVVRLFPCLRTLLVAGCGAVDDIRIPRREKGWSVRQDALWGKEAPLEQIRLECVAAWEVAALGSIHTSTLIITAMDGGNIVDAFQDQEIFPRLKCLRTEAKYRDLRPNATQEPIDDEGGPEVKLEATLEQICTDRGIEIEYDAAALMFPR